MASYIFQFFRTTAEWFAFMFLAYFAMAAIAYRMFWAGRSRQFEHKRIQQDQRRAEDPFAELSLSVLALLMLAVMLGAMHVLTGLGWAKFYYDFGEHRTGYFSLSILLMAITHDTYHYWAHRWMHSRLLFDRVHRLHHRFTNPTPFASFAFHPLEGVIDIAVIGLLILVMPIHPWALAIYYLSHTALNVTAHLGFEFYPAWVSRWFITSTYHNLHHSRFTGHYMLYFNFWDRVMRTSYADYPALCRRLAAAVRRPALDQKRMMTSAGG